MLHVMTVDLIQVHQSQRVPADLGFQGYVDLSSYNLDDVMCTNIWKSLKKKSPIKPISGAAISTRGDKKIDNICV